MRIDFQGSYKQVSKLLGASAEPASAPQPSSEFATTLANLNGQPPDLTQQIATPLPPPAKDLMASLHFEPPMTKSAPLAPFSGGLEPLQTVKESGNGVKTPSVLEVKRISIPPQVQAARVRDVAKMVSAEGKENGIDPALGMAVAEAESSFNPKAVSSDGHASKGLFQLLDETGKELHENSGVSGKYDPFNPDQNVALGVRYLRRLHDTFSQNTKLPNDLESVTAANSASLEKLAVAAFNAGEGRVASAQARAKAAGLNPGLYEDIESYLPKSTQEYVTRVMQLKTRFGHDDVG